MNGKVSLLDVVALLKNIPAHRLVVGQVGTVVELIDQHTLLVEFCNPQGETITTEFVKQEDVIVLHYDLVAA